jgi:hypothetical protein
MYAITGITGKVGGELARKALPNLFRLVSNSPAALQGYLGLSRALSKGALPAATRERIALAVAICFPAVAATHGRSSITWRSVMKVLITALALVTLIASPTFACQSRPHEYCDYPDTYWHCWDDVRCSAG